MEPVSQQSVRTQTETEAVTADDAPETTSTPSSTPSQPSAAAEPAASAPSVPSEQVEEAQPAAAPSSPAETANGVFDHNEQTQLDLPNPAAPAVWSPPLDWASTPPERAEPRLSPVSPRSPYPGAAPVSPRMPGQTPGNVPWEAASSWGATTLTITANTAAGASYLFWWVSGMLIYFNERHNRFVRFHAMQSILLTGAMTVFGVLAYILSSLCSDIYQATGLHAYSTLGTFIAATATILIVFVWLWAMIAAWSGNYMRLPIVGTYAERYSAPPLHPPTTF